MCRKQRLLGADTAYKLQRSFGRLLGLFIVSSTMTAPQDQPTTSPISPLPPRLPEPTHAALLERYRPVEERTKQWIASLPDSTTQVLGMQLYRAFLEAARHSWPNWPSMPYPAPFIPYTQKLRHFEAVVIATIVWVEWAEQELVPGILALTLLCDDLNTALGRDALRARLWRAEVWPPNEETL